MLVTTAVKQISIATGLYRPARWLSRRMRAWERREFDGDVDLYRALLPPGAVCFDVGANVGRKSEALLRAGAARVVSFEPNPQVLPELRARCAPWKNCTVVAAAVGSAGGIAPLYVRRYHGRSGLARDWADDIVDTCHVPVVTLDSAISFFGRPDYCKIDVEGYELEVLSGLSQPIPLLSFEFALREDYVQKAIACLERVNRFSPGKVNVTPAEASAFHFREWDRLERFRHWFPGDLKASLPGGYGDIFVKSDGA
jgi:FkbM family methyltransferase